MTSNKFYVESFGPIHIWTAFSWMRWQSPGERWFGLKALPLDWMEQSVVPLEMAFLVWRSYSGKRQSATYRPASAGSAFERLVEAQECLAAF